MIFQIKKLKKKLKNNYDFVVNLAGHVDHSNKKKTLNSHYGGCKNLTSLFVKSKIENLFKLALVLNMENRSRHKRKFNEQ